VPPVPPVFPVLPLLLPVLPPHPEIVRTDAKSRKAKIVGIHARLRREPKGMRKIAAVRKEPKPTVRTRALVWVAAVLMVTVNGAVLPPVTETVDGVKVQEAFVGRLLQLSVRVPLYPFAGSATSA
jgi:hypothetical protein